METKYPPLPTTIHGLNALNFTGPDASLATSLFEYGMAWRERTSESGQPDYQFLYRLPNNNFDTGFFKKDLDFKKEFNWISEENWEDFLSFLGSTWEEWNGQLMPQKIFDLYGYYGSENIFGSTYWEGIRLVNPAVQHQ